MRSPRTATKSGPSSPQLEKARTQQQRPNTAKNKLIKKKKKQKEKKSSLEMELRNAQEGDACWYKQTLGTRWPSRASDHTRSALRKGTVPPRNEACSPSLPHQELQERRGQTDNSSLPGTRTGPLPPHKVILRIKYCI